MTNESLKKLILAYNARSFASFYSLRPLTDTVTLGHVWLKHPTDHTANEESYKLYFVLSGSQCVAIVLEMGQCDLHWYVLEEYRKQGHLHTTLRDCILPHIFSDGRESQRVTVNCQKNADYVERQGFKESKDGTFVIHKDQVDVSKAPVGQNAPLSREEIEILKERLRKAKTLVMSVHENLSCHYGNVALFLDEIADEVGNAVSSISDLDEHENFA